MTKNENLNGSYDDGEVFILANDPKHSKRKQKMRNLDEKPIERKESQMSNHQFYAFIIIETSLAVFFVWALNNVTNLSPPL